MPARWGPRHWEGSLPSAEHAEKTNRKAEKTTIIRLIYFSLKLKWQNIKKDEIKGSLLTNNKMNF
jgi:hypothetical protein